METFDTYYAKAPDGALIAYQVVGDGPIDIVDQSDWPGNLDMQYEDPLGHVFLAELAKFSRVILHDRRGVGLSSRNVPLPNLETRVADLCLVLDAVGSERPILNGVFESGAPNALLAATDPKRVRSLVWTEPLPRFAWAPDFPWGSTPAELETELEQIDAWGTHEYGRAFVRGQQGRWPESYAAWMAKASRNSCTPDVAKDLARIWYDSDVRAILPSIQVPTMIIDKESDVGPGPPGYVASMIPNSELVSLPGAWNEEGVYRMVEVIRKFAGIDRPRTELDTVLSSVLFTDIVESTQRQASIGDHAWKDLVQQHHAIVRVSLSRWRGVEIDTAGDGFYSTFDGPARAIRCAQEITETVRSISLEVRAGIHTGECEIIDGKVGGLAVSIGARVSAKAQPSEVIVSQTVKDLVAGSGFEFEEAGEHQLKGVPDTWRLYRVMR